MLHPRPHRQLTLGEIVVKCLHDNETKKKIMSCESNKMPGRATGTAQTKYREPDKRQLKEQAGFLVSRNLTLPSAPP